MDLSARLQQLEQLVLEAKSMPLSSSVLVSREELLQMISEMQESIPEEIKQARWIVKDREDLLGKARAEGERIVEQAHEEQRRMALKEEVARIRIKVGRATPVDADVADDRQMTQIGMAAMREFGRIDTWVNNAGLGMYGRGGAQPNDQKRNHIEMKELGVG